MAQRERRKGNFKRAEEYEKNAVRRQTEADKGRIEADPELVRIGVAELLRALERSDPEAFIATGMGPDNRQTAIDGTFDLEAVVTALAVVLLSMSRSESD